VPFPDVSNKSVAARVFYAATGIGHLAVMVFFVLSGYLVGGRLLARYCSGNASIPRYLLDRFTRLYIVLIPALLITALFDRIGVGAFNANGVYSHSSVPEVPGIKYSILERLDLRHLLSNLCMLLGSPGCRPAWRRLPVG